MGDEPVQTIGKNSVKPNPTTVSKPTHSQLDLWSKATLFQGHNDRAVIVNRPENFNLRETLSDAQSVWLATAFAHLSGWKLLEPGILAGDASVRIVTGLDFCQTEPRLLRLWKRLSESPSTKPRIMIRLLTIPGTTFHPKVLVVAPKNGARTFAIVGSGNLSLGGLTTNWECALYSDDQTYVDTLLRWFNFVNSEPQSYPLSNSDIRAYTPRWKRAHKASQRVRAEERAAKDAITKRQATVFREREETINAARTYFRTAEFQQMYAKRKQAVDRMSQVLDFPRLDFTSDGWRQFLSIPELGRLRRKYQKQMLEQLDGLREAVKYLLSTSVPVDTRLSAVLAKNGKYHVPGLGPNVVSKLLAVMDASAWPVFNEPVNFTLKYFGYETPRGAGATGRYLRFVEVMRDFMKDSGAPDVLALDAFFWYWYDKRKLPPTP